MRIRNQADLERENIRMAWSMADKMTDDQYEQLCRVTVQSWRRESESAVRGSGFEAAGAIA
jgi:hypothetical protein